jgi:NAD(P)H-quinone oxidoreductase subunit 5
VLGRAALAATVVAALYFALQNASEWLLAGVVPAARPVGGGFDAAIVAAVVGAFGAVTLLQNELARRPSLPFFGALYVHLANGLYAATLINRLAVRLWPAPAVATHEPPGASR